MDKQEHIVATADIRYTKTKLARILTIAFLIIVVLSLIIGIKYGSSSGSCESKIDNNTSTFSMSKTYLCTKPAYDYVFIDWFGVEFYKEALSDYNWRPYSYTNSRNIILVAALYIVLLSLPFIITAIIKHKSKVTSLTITDSQAYGSYNGFLSKKSLKMPIENIDNITTISTFMDKFHSGVTLGILSASGTIKLHFVQNADEIITATLERIEEIRKSKSRTVALSVASDSSFSRKMKNLAQLKEQGLITEEEFNKKREDILSRM